MATKSAELARPPVVFDLGEVEAPPVIVDFSDVRTRTDYPIWAICQAIRSAVQPTVSSEKLEVVYTGVKEIVGDVEKHADSSDIMAMILHRVIGGIGLHTFSTKDKLKEHVDAWGEDPDHNGFGEPILEGLFGDDYKSIQDGEVFERHLFIRDGEVDQQFPRIHHNN